MVVVGLKRLFQRKSDYMHTNKLMKTENID